MPVEEILRRELREVADGLPVPALPPLPQEPPRSSRHWVPLLVAAAVLLIVAVAAVATSYRDSTQPDPAPQPPEPSIVRPLTAQPPTVPYVFDRQLYIDGDQIPGDWLSSDVTHAGDAWATYNIDSSTVQWGTTGEPSHDIPGRSIGWPKLSPDGTVLAVSTSDGGGQVLLIDTESGETLNALPFDAIGATGPNQPGVVAVADDARVFLDGGMMWLADDEGDEVVNLATTAPGQRVEGATAAGLIVLDPRDRAYLANVSDSGALDRVRDLPTAEVFANPSGTWLAYGGSFGGESQTIPYVTALPVDGGPQLRLRPPDRRSLVAVAWEDDDKLLAELWDNDPTGLARCSIRERRCVEIELP